MSHANAAVAEDRPDKERLRLLSSAVEQSSEGIAVSDLEGNLLFVNKAFAAMHGYAPEELVGRHLSVFHTEDQMPAVKAANRQILDGGEFSGEIWHVQRDGTSFPTLMHNTLLRDEVGQPIGMIGTLRDITDREKIEQALRTSQDRYELAVNAGKVGVWDWDLRTDEMHIDPNLKALLGYEDHEIRNHLDDWGKLVWPEDQARVNEAADAHANGTRAQYEVAHRMRHKDGSLRWFLARGTLIRDDAGRPVRMVGTHTDITVRKQAEEALRETESRYRAVVEDQTELVCRFLPDGTLTFVNESYCRYFDKKREALIGHGFMPLIPEEDREKPQRQLASLSQETPVGTIEHRVVAPGGEIRWQRWTNRAIFDDQGEIVEFQAVGRDITERKKVEEALRRSEEHFRSLIENALDVIAVLREDGTIRYASPSFQRVLGYDPQKLVGTNAFELVHPDDAPTIISAFERGNQMPGHVETTEFRFRHKDGSWRFVEATGTNLLHDPAVGGAVINARDITERKQAEEARLVFSQSIEQSSDAIFILDADNRITFSNRAAEQLYGYAAEEMKGRRPRDLFRIDLSVLKEAWAALKRDRRWSGLSDVCDKQGNRFTIEANSMLICDAKGHAIAAVTLTRDARGSRRLTSIQQVAEAVAGTEITDDEAIQRIMSHLPELAGLDRWSIYLHNAERDVLELRFCSESGREVAEAVPVIPASAPLTGQVFRAGEILFTPDVGSDLRFTKNAVFRDALATPSGKTMRATCILPLRSGGRILGTLYLSDGRVRNFTPDELSALKTLASQIGLLLGRTAHGLGARSRPAGRELPDVVDIVAESEAMKLVLRSSQRFAKTTMPTVILGPTGAGKGHLAKYIHSISRRGDGPFLTVNCACLDGELILSEMFGHERGAFTGAVRQQKGCFELANGGTLLLDEMVELPPSAQAKLLQLVETQQFRRLGGQQTITTDVRVICTTNADVRECVRSGKLRQDLYYRLNAAEVVIPPLSERPEDIRPLALAYLRTYALTMGEPVRSITDGALARLHDYHWPGNVRELQNVLASAISHGGQVIGARDLRFTPIRDESAGMSGGAGRGEREMILEALRRNRWNRTLAAEELGVHRNTLRNRMRKYGIFE